MSIYVGTTAVHMYILGGLNGTPIHSSTYIGDRASRIATPT